MPERRYFAFLSYSHADKRWADWLHRKLETYRTPRKLVGRETPYGPAPARLAPIFRDREELSAADSLSAEIEAALSAAGWLIVLCSPRAAQSKWVNKEILRFKQLHGEGRVLAAIIGGEPGDAAKECFPHALKFRIGADGQLTDEPTEPIAADLRRGKDGKTAGLHKLIAGLIGVKLDEIVEREAQRRTARLRVAVGAVSALAIVFAGIAWEALRQRNIAETQRVEAVAARGDAEDLVEFMLTDLRTRLDAVGRLDVLDSVGERALAYYDARDLSAADPNALGRRARAQLLVGEIDNLRGDLDAALVAYEAAAATTAEQLRRNPNAEQQIFDHAQSVFWVGYIAWQRGDADAARIQFAEYYDLAQRLVELDPNNDDWRLEVTYATTNLGILELEQGRPAEAEERFRTALDASLLLLEKEPDNIERILATGQYFAWLDEAAAAQLDFAEARRLREREIELYESRLAVAPSNNEILEKKLIAHRASGIHALAVNALDEALREVTLAAQIAETLLAVDAENLQWLEFSALADMQRGEIHFHRGDYEDALTYLDIAARKGRRLLASGDEAPSWIVNFVIRPIWIHARIHRARGEFDLAREKARACHRDADRLVASGAQDLWTPWSYAVTLSLGLELDAHEDKSWADVVAILDDAHAAHALVYLSRAHAELGDHDAARRHVQRLHAAGYRHPDFLTLLDEHPRLRSE